MTDAELDEVEDALGRPLPEDYREFARTCSDQDWKRYCRYLYRSPKKMIQENQDHPLRTPDSDVRERDGAGGVRVRPWPTEWTIVGDGDSEWYTFVRPDAPGVWEWQHDTREVAQVAPSFAEYFEQQREAIGPPPELEVTRHPILGELSWDPERRVWDAKIADVKVVLKPWAEDRVAFLASAAELVPAAVAAERRVLTDAMTAGGWAEFLDWTDGDDRGLTSETVRERLGRPTIVITPGPVAEYLYQSGVELNYNLFWAKTDASLAVTEQGWAS